MQRLGLEFNNKAEVDALSALKKLVCRRHGFTVLPHGVILPEIGNEDFAFRRLVEPEIAQSKIHVGLFLQRPTTLAMRELARRVRVELTKAVADGRMVVTPDRLQLLRSQTDGTGE